MSDIAQIIHRAASGDANAFDEIVRQYQNPAVAYAYSLLGSRARAEDAAQEAFLQAWRDLPALKDAARFGGWLRRIVFKFADRDRRRERPTVSWDSIGEVRDTTNVAQEAAMSETQQAVRDIVATLAEGERVVISLHYMGGYTTGEIAAFLQITESTVKKRLERARRRLVERMAVMMQEEMGAMAPSKETRFVEVARLLRQITTVLEADETVVAAYLAPFGRDEGFGAGNDAWASLNVHAVRKDGAMDALATGRGEYIRRVAEPILWVDAQQNAPPRGYYRMAIYDAPAGPYEVDWYWHPETGATIPADARALFNRGDVPVVETKQSWEYTVETDYPAAIRAVWERRTPEEAHQEETRNTVHFFWAMWLIAAKYTARDPQQKQVPFVQMLGNLLADTRKNIHGTEWIKPEPAPNTPTLSEKVAALRVLADEMTALGQTPPDAVPRFLTLVENTR